MECRTETRKSFSQCSDEPNTNQAASFSHYGHKNEKRNKKREKRNQQGNHMTCPRQLLNGSSQIASISQGSQGGWWVNQKGRKVGVCRARSVVSGQRTLEALYSVHVQQLNTSSIFMRRQERWQQ